MKYEEVKNKYLEPDESEVSQLLAAIPKADAPGDFYFRVKGSIAKAKSVGAVGSRAGWKYGVAAGAFAVFAVAIIVGSVFIVNENSIVSNIETPAPQEQPEALVLSENSTQVIAADTDLAENSQFESTDPAKIDAPAKTEKVSAPSKRKRIIRLTGGGSRDIAIKAARKPILKREPSELSTREMLTSIGIDAEFTDNAYTVKSISPKSAAEQSGVKTGDKIETIDDRPVNDTLRFPRDFKGKAINLTREGQKLQLNLLEKKP